jgi:L-2-hydroxyglutarate oxidase
MADAGRDVVVVGGGIVGVATAMAVLERAHCSLAVIEAEERLAAHQTGHNSGVIHSGLYYRPGSAKAKTCVEGRQELLRFCRDHGIAHEVCGKVVVATSEEQLPVLESLRARGEANGLVGLRSLSAAEIRELEPHAAGVAGLHVPETGIVDYTAVTEAYAGEVCRRGGEIRTGTRLRRLVQTGSTLVAETSAGPLACRAIVNCAGLQSDRVARMCGVEPGVRIVPFRGEYFEVRKERRHLVRNLIYPVPNPEFPFLGVHFTRSVTGEVEAGPNAVLALKREGYTRTSFSPRDSWATLAFPGFWRLAGRYMRTGLGEMWRSWNKSAFVRALQELLPEITADDLVAGGAGVRAQALDGAGRLVDDFRIVEAPGQVHVLNAPSPAATASIAIGRAVADLAIKSFALRT